MGLKRRNKVSAEFSMSSLTDIIFLLLIFFMLTANFVQIKPFDLPESDSKTVAATSIVVSVDKQGKYSLNNTPIRIRSLERALRKELRDVEDRSKVTITIVAQKDVAFDYVTKVIVIAGKLRVNAILATQPKS